MQEYKDLVIQAKNDSKYMQSLLCIMEPLVKSYAKKTEKKKNTNVHIWIMKVIYKKAIERIIHLWN